MHYWYWDSKLNSFIVMFISCQFSEAIINVNETIWQHMCKRFNIKIVFEHEVLDKVIKVKLLTFDVGGQTWYSDDMLVCRLSNWFCSWCMMYTKIHLCPGCTRPNIALVQNCDFKLHSFSHSFTCSFIHSQ